MRDIGCVLGKHEVLWTWRSSLQLMDTMQSRSRCAAMEEPTLQQWMWPEGGTAHGSTHRSSPGPELQPVERRLWWGRQAGGAAARADSAGASV